MSKVVDDRVVSMQFDNRHFENNVHKSLNTLDKLKQSLNLTGAAKGLENVDAAAKGINLGPLTGAVESTRLKFSALQVTAVTALSNIVNTAVNAGKRIVSSLTIDPVKTGLHEYETQINAVQTIMSNTRSKGTTLDNVNNALDELNKYADMTIYNFTEMTRNIGTFTAAGVDLDTSVSAIKGIANLAAVSGSTSQQASTAMYQLSQALSSGTVKLMDWNSVVNAGMGGQVFQDALKETARAQGVAIDDMIKNEGSFRETLHNGWLTSAILTETLSKFTGDLTDEQLKSMGYTDEQIKGILALGKDANDAATKVKTFTQLLDTLKEAAQSGWAQTWEVLIGDFEEAKALWTKVSDVFGNMINESAQARNSMLQGWADDGGREMALESIKNAFQGILSVLKPIKEAFRDVFPKTTSDQLIKITERIRDFTKNLKLTESAQAKLKSTFKGLFAVVDIGVTIIKEIVSGAVTLISKVLGLTTGVIGLTGTFGDWISNIRDSIKETGIFSKIIGSLVNTLQRLIGKIKEVFDYVGAKIEAPGLEGVTKLFNGIFEIVKVVAQKIGSAIKSIGKVLGNAFRSGDINNAIDIVNSLLAGGLLLSIKKFVSGFGESLEDITGITGKVGEILDSAKGTFEAYQNDLKANVLKKIAIAIGILAVSLLLIASIDSEKLTSALMAISLLFANLLVAMAVFSKISGQSKHLLKSLISMSAMSKVMVTMATAILILATALAIVSGIDSDRMVSGIMGIAALTAILLVVTKIMSQNKKTVIQGATGLIAFAFAIKILASAVEDLASLNWGELAKGLVAVGVLVGLVGVFLSNTKFGKKAISNAIGMVILASAIKILVSAVKDFGAMNWSELGKGFAGIAGSLIIVAAALKLMPKNMVSLGLGLVAVSASLLIIASAMGKMGGMSWGEIGKSITVLAGSLLILAVGLKMMSKTLLGSAALLVAALALAVLIPELLILGSMSWGSIVKSLVSLAGAFLILGVAGAVLAPIIPSLIGLGLALALTGAGVLALGVGITAISIGLTALATAISTSGTIIVAGIIAILTGIISLIPSVFAAIGEGIILIISVIASSATSIAEAVLAIVKAVAVILVEAIPILVDTIFKLVDALLKKLVEYTPTLVTAVFDILVACLDGIADGLPKVIQSATDLVISFLEGLSENLPRIVDAGFEFVINFIDGLTKAIDENTPILVEKVRELALSILRAMILVFTGGIVDIKVIGEKIMKSGFIQGIKNKYSNAKTEFSNLITDIQTSISETLSDWKEIGGNIIDGLKQGILDKFTSVAESAVNVVSGAKEAVRNFLGINSPSKEYANIGRYMDEGLVVGLNKYAGKVVNVSKNVGNKAVNAMSKSISNIASIVNSDIDSQPTIKPVLDLSNIRSGAGMINGLLGSDATVGVLANVGAINSMMTQRQNGVTQTDVVAELKNLGKKIGNTQSNQYNINGVTYDDGSNVATAIEELFRALRIERRS